MAFIFHNVWDNPSHWRTHIFQDGYCTTNHSWIYDSALLCTLLTHHLLIHFGGSIPPKCWFRQVFFCSIFGTIQGVQPKKEDSMAQRRWRLNRRNRRGPKSEKHVPPKIWYIYIVYILVIYIYTLVIYIYISYIYIYSLYISYIYISYIYIVYILVIYIVYILVNISYIYVYIY